MGKMGGITFDYPLGINPAKLTYAIQVLLFMIILLYKMIKQ